MHDSAADEKMPVPIPVGAGVFPRRTGSNAIVRPAFGTPGLERLRVAQRRVVAGQLPKEANPLWGCANLMRRGVHQRSGPVKNTRNEPPRNQSLRHTAVSFFIYQ